MYFSTHLLINSQLSTMRAGTGAPPLPTLNSQLSTLNSYRQF
ncbi:MAG: hypothetical protein ACRC62_09495 [Microcoleus sp.]